MNNNFLKHLGVIFIITIIILVCLAELNGNSFYIGFSFLTGRDFLFAVALAVFIWPITISSIK